MIVLCSWCLRDRQPAFIEEREPREDQSETHGLCLPHRAEVDAELRERIAAGTLPRRRP
jgi:hypothetical protein